MTLSCSQATQLSSLFVVFLSRATLTLTFFGAFVSVGWFGCCVKALQYPSLGKAGSVHLSRAAALLITFLDAYV